MSKLNTPKPQENFSCVNIQVLTSGGQINGVAPFKDNIPPYGAFANTTAKGAYPVKQKFMSNGEPLKISGIDGDVIWPTSENAYHAQKIIAWREELKGLDSSDARIQVLDDMLVKLTQEPYMPKGKMPSFEKLVHLNLNALGIDEQKGTFPSKEAAGKAMFDKLCKAEYHVNYNSNPDSGFILHDQANDLPQSYAYMKLAVKLKLEQHPELAEAAKEFARRGIMPMEISQHDENWASGIKGEGRNLLGLAILELGNDLISTEERTIFNPHKAYTELQQKNSAKVTVSKWNNNTKKTEVTSEDGVKDINFHAMRGYVNNKNKSGKAYNPMNHTIPTITQPKVKSTIALEQAARVLPSHIQSGSAMGRTLAKIQEQNNATDISLIDDRGRPDKKMVRITFTSPQDAANFAKFANNAPIDGSHVLLGEDRAPVIFQKLGIEKHGRQNPRPMLDSLKFEHNQNNISATLGQGQPAKQPIKKDSPKTQLNNKLENYYVPYLKNEKKGASGGYVSAIDQAQQIFDEMQRRLIQDPSAKVAITYSANGDQCKDITDGYSSGEYKIGGGNQAIVFGHLAKKIQEAGLQDRLHILPIATMKHSGNVGKVDADDVNRDMANVAQHAGSGWQVLGLQNTKTPDKNKPYAIGGGIGAGFHATSHSQRIQSLMKAMAQGDYSDPILDAAYKKGQADGVTLTTTSHKKMKHQSSESAGANMMEKEPTKLADSVEKLPPVKIFSSIKSIKKEPEKEDAKKIKKKSRAQPEAVTFSASLSAGISEHSRNLVIEESDLTLKELETQLQSDALQEQLGIKFIRTKDLTRFQNNPGLEIEFEIESADLEQTNQTFTGYAEELPGKKEGDKPRVEYSIDKGMEQRLEEAAIARMCEMAVATAKPNTEFNLQNTPAEQRDAVFNALNDAVAKKLEDGTFDEESLPKIVGFDVLEKGRKLSNK